MSVEVAKGEILEGFRVKAEDDRLEALADLEHQQWAHWTTYMLDALYALTAGSGVDLEALPCVKRWRRQIDTPYAELSEKEKESDREWARKVLEVAER